MAAMETAFTRQVGIEVPLICGAMYPCSNPELIAAVSAAGGIGIIQPISMTFVHKRDLRDGIRWIRAQTDKPIGFNAIVEKSSDVYTNRMKKWVDIALEEGVRFVITSLGNPRWVVDRVASAGGTVYHDVTDRRWALKAIDAGVHGLIAVNSRAGGHAGGKTAEALFAELRDLGLPLICAGGIGAPDDFRSAMALGYAGVQMGTRFIASTECGAHPEYKQAIVDATASDIVLTQRLTGVPVAVIRNAYVDRLGLRAGPIARFMLKNRRTKHLMRSIYALRSLRQLKNASLSSRGAQEYWQAGKSVDGVHSVEPAGDIVRAFAAALPDS